ncbi:hypothetical protein RJ640_021647 [Escallonia rubra]|uniref:Ribosomal protein eL8/eL30/eS12/Gadd45 domain-containing protein n=1 Tax=Escallonia rubra TaxID=112253 RepID=A0AA88QZI6_9ASTE|nr:hypothetical protein RJ640_021647 [Escallonia rubra]
MPILLIPLLNFQQHFSVGVNDVTRVLERMPPVAAAAAATGSFSRLDVSNRDSADNSGPTLQLQAILLASDCNPRWLTKHLPSLASSRQVPVIYVKDKGGSLRLGELVKLKTAIAIGVKVTRSNFMNVRIVSILYCTHGYSCFIFSGLHIHIYPSSFM